MFLPPLEWPFDRPWTTFSIEDSYPKHTYEERMKIISRETVYNFKKLERQ